MQHEPEQQSPPAEPQTEEVQAVTLAEFKIPCRHLRSKEMYYQDFGAAEDQYASGIHWCGRTQESFGPDGHSCGKEECGSERSCYLI